MKGLYKVISFLTLIAFLGWLWWVALGRATNPRFPPPRKVVEIRPAPLLTPPRANFDLREFRWRYEEGSFKWH